MDPDAVRQRLAAMELDQLPVESLPQWAAEALAAGLDSPALRALAGLAPRETDLARVLMRTVAGELGVILLSKQESRWVLVRAWAVEIITGTLPPEVGASRIWMQWSEASADGEDAPSEWLPFVAARSDWDELPDRQEEIRRDIRAEAERLIALASDR